MGPRPATGCNAGKWSAAAASASPSLATRAPGNGRVAAPACEPESPSNSRLNPRSASAVKRLLPEGDGSGQACRSCRRGQSGRRRSGRRERGQSGDGAPPGGTRAEAGMGGGVLRCGWRQTRRSPCRQRCGRRLRRSGRSLTGAGGAPADPPKSNDNPEGGGPEVDAGEGDESKSKLSGGPPPVACKTPTTNRAPTPAGVSCWNPCPNRAATQAVPNSWIGEDCLDAGPSRATQASPQDAELRRVTQASPQAAGLSRATQASPRTAGLRRATQANPQAAGLRHATPASPQAAEPCRATPASPQPTG